MIASFKCRETEKVWNRKTSRKFSTITTVAHRRLWMISIADTLNDLRVPPGNRLEKLSRDRKGQHSIRINDQWRICFKWINGAAHEVEITDYH